MDTSPRSKAIPQAPLHAADVRLQFIDWAKQHGHNPVTGAAAFVALQSDLDLDTATRAMQMQPGEDRRDALRQHLAALAGQDDVAVQFPPVYAYTAANGLEYRYSLMLVIAEDCVEWTGRVWQGLDYQGMLTGRGQGPRANYTLLARMALEHELDQEHPRYVQS
ncbi:hypothetical protein [Xanthomonas maliensis]|uniref:hypothetical protein n=1 Tax=Xanthomonas maliensis TaxID=1321368 RepID=UPI00039D9AA3|nr:hypothetical protein [Xanthomonas maliensis]KAB7769950.1 hypothetical protein CKY51_05550 [Xanthomonas maliensis]